MAAAFQPAPRTPRLAWQWRRRRHRRWVRPNDLPDAAALFAMIPSLPRATLARIATRMIDRMDEMGGDCDLEPLREDDEDDEDGGDQEEIPYA